MMTAPSETDPLTRTPLSIRNETATNTEWKLPETSVTLPEQAMHLWRVDLSQTALWLKTLAGFLTFDEQERANRFYFDTDRETFIITRGVLRHLLGAYLQLPPNQLRFRYGAHGKPHFADGRYQALHFNVSHSRNFALLGFVWRHAIGVDVEFMRDGFASFEMARRFFAPGEIDSLEQLETADFKQGFFNCWTRKEAYIKAVGKGLSQPLSQFEVSLQPGVRPAILYSAHDPDVAEKWSVFDLNMATNYAAAAMVEGQGWQVHCWDWHYWGVL